MKNRSCLVVLAIVLILGTLLLCAGGAVAAANLGFFAHGRATVSETISGTLPAGSPASLQVRGKVGTVTIVAGSENAIQIEAQKEARAQNHTRSQELLNAIQVQTDIASEIANVIVVLPQTLPGENVKVDLRIRVPRQTQLDIVNNVGDVEVQGTAGDVRVRNDVGSIALRDVDVPADCDLQTGTGDVSFQGRLPESQGTVLLRSRVGDVTARVPNGSQFWLDAETKVGGIESSFVLDQVQSSEASAGEVGHWLRGRANSGAGVKLVLRTGTGSITVEQSE